MRYSPQPLNIVNGANKHIYIGISTEYKAIVLKDSCLELVFFMELEAAGKKLYEDGTLVQYMILGPIALFSKYKLTSSN